MSQLAHPVAFSRLLLLCAGKIPEIAWSLRQCWWLYTRDTRDSRTIWQSLHIRQLSCSVCVWSQHWTVVMWIDSGGGGWGGGGLCIRGVCASVRLWTNDIRPDK